MTLLIFAALALIPLAIDISTHRDKTKPITLTGAAAWSTVYIATALLFAGYLKLYGAPEDSSLFLTGYALEKTLSVDNLMIFSAIFSYFGVVGNAQHRVLHWGIIGSVVLRLIFVVVGVGAAFLFGRFIEILFGAFVLWTAWKFSGEDDPDEAVDYDDQWYIRAVRMVIPVAFSSDAFFVRRRAGEFNPFGFAVTHVFLCLIAIEVTDVAFAFDSVPAVVAVTKKPLLVYSSIMFAILGLRSLYFVLDALQRYLVYLKKAVMGVLFFIGSKLLLHGVAGIEIDPDVSLWIILSFIGAGIAASLLLRRDPEPHGN